MENQRSLALLRTPRTLDISGDSKTGLYGNIKKGLWTPGVVLGKNRVAWPEYEVREITAARIAGKSEEEIKVLVRRLIADRTKLAG